MLVISLCAAIAAAVPPEVAPGYRLELVAREPQIVTPVALAFDPSGRLWVIESHTHERPPDYVGPTADRIRMFSDSNADGRLDQWSTWWEGAQQAMNLLATPQGSLYVVTRRDVRLLSDADRDGTAETAQQVLRLDTKAEYPHNGLSGIALDQQGHLYAGLGENFGETYRLVGSDNSSCSGHGGAGTVFRCNPQGANVRRFAIGFWNPFGLSVTHNGHLVCIDNDPDASPPCRLMHVVETADFGFRYVYGRAGMHPLQAWDGELPGTLPMAAGTGEAPCSVIWHANALWVTSWGEHRVERYHLIPQGGSFLARREIIVQGNHHFRPTGLAAAPDGSLYVADWVRRDYPVHGRGKIWRLIPAQPTAGTTVDQVVLTESERDAGRHIARAFALQAQVQRRVRHHSLASPSNIGAGAGPALVELMALRWKSLDDPTSSHRGPAGEPKSAEDGAASAPTSPAHRDHGADNDPPGTSQAPADTLSPAPGGDEGEALVTTLRAALSATNADSRLFALRWIAEARVKSLRVDVERLLEKPIPSPRYYLAVLATMDWLDREPMQRHSGIADGLLARELRHSRRSDEARALALQLIAPTQPSLTPKRLEQFLSSTYLPLRREAVRTLAQRAEEARWPILKRLAVDPRENAQIREEAVAGLALAPPDDSQLLLRLAEDPELGVAREADRILRWTGRRPSVDERKPPVDALTEWLQITSDGGDPHAGRQIFFSPLGPRCSACHAFNGRGARSGPDLSLLARRQSRERILVSILQPSQEIAPDYQAWTLETNRGQVLLGLRQPQAGDSGLEHYVDPRGVPFTLRSSSIAHRQLSQSSIMPDGLEQLLSLQELRDLLTYLESSGD